MIPLIEDDPKAAVRLFRRAADIVYIAECLGWDNDALTPTPNVLFYDGLANKAQNIYDDKVRKGNF